MVIKYYKHNMHLDIMVAVEDGGLKLHVVEPKPIEGMTSPSGGLLLEFILNNSVSLMVAMDNERTTDPGVMLGSSSIDFNWVP